MASTGMKYGRVGTVLSDPFFQTDTPEILLKTIADTQEILLKTIDLRTMKDQTSWRVETWNQLFHLFPKSLTTHNEVITFPSDR